MPACNVSSAYFHATENEDLCSLSPLFHICVDTLLVAFSSSEPGSSDDSIHPSQIIVNLPRTHANPSSLFDGGPHQKMYPTFFKFRGENTDIITSPSLTISNSLLEVPSDAELDHLPLGDGNLAALEVTRHPRCSIDHLELSKASNPNSLSIYKVLLTRV